MKTYKKTIEKTCLDIQYDGDCESPRSWSNLGYFIIVDRNYNNPDKNEELREIIRKTGEEATSKEEHIRMIKEDYEWENSENKVIAIYPIVKYEHEGVAYSLGSMNGFDYSNNGFYIVTKENLIDYGVPNNEEDLKNFFCEDIIKQELELYNSWLNGKVYSFMLYDNKGKVVDSCGGFYNIEDIREHLPEEWSKEDLQDYFKLGEN